MGPELANDINNEIKIIELSAKTEKGFNQWINWILKEINKK